MSTIVSWAQGSSLSGTGSGTEADPYRIYNVYQLAQLNNFQDQPGAVFELMNNLDMSEFINENNPMEGWDPVNFSGILKGKNHTIKGLYINRGSIDYVGFFGVVSSATITNLTIEGTSVKGRGYVGGFVGQATGSTFTNCKISLTSQTAVSGQTGVGGFAGLLYGSTVTSCNSTGNVNSTNGVVGGFVGEAANACTIDNSVVKSTVKGASTTGGFAGSSLGCIIKNITLQGNVTGTLYTGGIVGDFSGEIHNATMVGDVSGKAYTGGVVGRKEDTRRSAISDVNMSGSINGNSYTGGVAGSVKSILDLTNIVVKGNVLATTYNNVGGVVGCVSGSGDYNTISFTGDVKGSSNVSGGVGELAVGSSVAFDNVHTRGVITNTGDYTGGIVGKSSGICVSAMESCSHFGDIYGCNYVGGLVGSIVETTEEPVLHTWYQSKSKMSNDEAKGPFRDTVTKGNVTTKLINNCCVVGNVSGDDYIGGLFGDCKNGVYYLQTTSSVGSASYTVTKWAGTGPNDFYDVIKPYYNWCDDVLSEEGKKVTIINYTRDVATVSLSNSSYSGVVTGKDYVGGIAGYKEGGSILNCFSNSTITGESNVGGVAGYAIGDASFSLSIKSNVVSSPSISASETKVGRIYGERGTNVVIGALGSNESNRAFVQCAVTSQGVAQVISTNEQNGNSIGASMLKLKANYVSWGWDFDSNWDILETESYPYKKYQAAPPYLESKLVSQSTTISGKSVNGGIVNMYYRDRDAVTFDCGSGHDFTFTTEPLQSGSQIQLFADVDGMVPSYFNSITVQYPGSGTEDDPYLIYTAEDLHLMPGAGYFKIMNDIDLAPWIAANSPTTGWIPVGGNSSMGTYIDGNGCTISGLWMNTDAQYSGLFASFTSGYIKNLNVKVASGKKVKGGQYTGILIGKMANGQIQNCTVEGDAAGTKYLGGLAGATDQVELTGNTADVNLTISASGAYVGGIAGLAQGVQAVNDNVSGSISTSGASSYVGGLFGKTSEGEVTKSQANVTINVAAAGTESKVGGLIGQSSTPVSLCYTTGSVKALGADSYTAGLVGYADNTISDSYTTAEITGTLYTAGIAGYTTSTINKCYVSGNIHGQRWGAGIVGYLDGSGASLTNSVVVSNILSVNHEMAWACRVIGGFKNGAAEPDASNYALNTMQVSINDVPKTVIDDQVEGIAKTETELKSSATYSALGWDMTRTWSIAAGYPTLMWLSEANPVTEVVLDETSLSLIAGKNAQLTATIRPASATNKQVTWTSSNTAVATVADGLVTAVVEGEATITVTSTENPEISASCEVTVSASLESAIAALRTLVSEAQSLYDNSTEGESAGQYEAGSRAALLAVIITVNGKISDEMTQSAIAECTTQINDAVTTFRSHVVSAGEDTDISAYDNIIYIEKTDAGVGCTKTLSVKIKNDMLMTGYQCDIYLPDGMSFTTDEDGFYNAFLSTARTTVAKTNYFDCAIQPDGALRLLCNSTKGYAFSGTDGEVATVEIAISDGLEDGDYPILIRGNKLSEKTGFAGVNAPNVKTTLTVTSVILGDANGDTSIDVSDFSATASYILGERSPRFVYRAANINGDSDIDVSDLSGISYLILYGSLANAPQRAAVRTAQPSTLALSDLSIVRGHEAVMYVYVNNPSEMFSGIQFDLNLPEGIQATNVALVEERTTWENTDFCASKMIDENKLRVLCASTKNNPVEGSDGRFIAITLVADQMAENSIITATNGVLTLNGNSSRLAETRAEISIADPLGIEAIIAAGEPVTVYSASGIIVLSNASAADLRNLPEGMYIINGNRIIK